MGNAMIRQEQPIASAIEQVVITGDLKSLTSAQRVEYYNRVCESVGLNPFTRPFDYITLNGKLTLYARRDAADQLRSLHGISLSKPHIEYSDDMVIVTVEATDREGRNDTDLGAVSIKNLQGEARANAIMKAITKAKRRVTLSLAGLGWLDETEVDSIPGAQRVIVDTATGEIVDATVTTQPAPNGHVDGDEVFSREGQGKTNPPLKEETVDAPPTTDELTTIKQWSNRTEAEMWAVMIGACDNEFEAKNSLNKSVAKYGGKVSKENIESIYVDYMRHQQAKLRTQPVAA